MQGNPTAEYLPPRRIKRDQDKRRPGEGRTLISHQRHLIPLLDETLGMIHHPRAPSDIAEDEDDGRLAPCPRVVVSCEVVCEERERWEEEEQEDEELG